jgi:type II secretory pathway pseudopilin PulG
MDSRARCIPNRREAAIEIWTVLVVLAVLLALAMLLLPSINSRPPALRSKSAVVIRHIVNALKAYENDHGSLPKIGQPRNPSEKLLIVGEAIVGASVGNEAVFDVLRSIPRGPNAGHALNPRQQKYYEDQLATDPKNPREGFADGKTFADEVQGRLFDPWGSQYCIVVETDDDRLLNLGTIYRDLAGPEKDLRYSVVAFSLGKDKAPGGKGYSGFFRRPNSVGVTDDIASWSDE